MNDPESSAKSPAAVSAVETTVYHVKSEPVYAPALRELLDWLCRSRKRLAILYLTALAIWMVLSVYGLDVLLSPFPSLPSFVEAFVINASNASPAKLHVFRIGIIVAFCVLQGLFLFGGGKIRVQPGAVRWYRMSVSLAIFAMLMALICMGFAFSYFELSSRIQVPDIFKFNPAVVLSTAALWVFWIGIGLVGLRNTNHTRGLSRLITCLLAGSWIEFAVALPIELVARDRHQDCPCASGSWLALLVCGPILFWSIGPGIFLLFFREKTACQRDPRHSRRILLAKSIRGGIELGA
jgi:hypothetical protein